MRTFRRPIARCVLSVLLVFTVTAVGCVGDDPMTQSPEGQEKIVVTPVTPQAQLRAKTDFGDAIGVAQRTDTGIQATLKDPSGRLLATLDWNEDDGTVVLDSPGVSHLEGFDDGKEIKLKGSTYAVYFYWTQVQEALDARDGLASDLDKAPGCDYFPDAWETECIRACCDFHDACWGAFDCTLLSWIGVGNPACTVCNIAVVVCIGACVVKEIVGVFLPTQH